MGSSIRHRERYKVYIAVTDSMPAYTLGYRLVEFVAITACMHGIRRGGLQANGSAMRSLAVRCLHLSRARAPQHTASTTSMMARPIISMK